MKTRPIVKGIKLGEQKDPTVINILCDCPHCGGEEFWSVFSGTTKIIFGCQKKKMWTFEEEYVVMIQS